MRNIVFRFKICKQQKLAKQIYQMENPQIARDLSPQVMFNYTTHRNIPWNVPEYEPVRQYVDPTRQMAERIYKQQVKGQPDSKYKTKRGFYMDYHIKTVKAIPPPCQYNLKDLFDQAQNRKQSKSRKIDDKLIKYTYIERIQMDQKNRKSPAPGDYSLTKSEAQIKQELQGFKSKKRSIGQKRFFYEDFQNLSSSVPGMGSYNPHFQVSHIRPDKKDCKFWVQKHKKISQSYQKKRLSQPDPGSYSPCPLNMTTFDRIKTADLINKRKKNIKTTGFGTDQKFPYQRKSKIVIQQQRPSPSAYNTGIEWKGKDMESRKNNWVRSVSTGFSQSIYNC